MIEKQPSAKNSLAKYAITWEKTSEQKMISDVGMKSTEDELWTI